VVHSEASVVLFSLEHTSLHDKYPQVERILIRSFMLPKRKFTHGKHISVSSFGVRGEGNGGECMGMEMHPTRGATIRTTRREQRKRESRPPMKEGWMERLVIGRRRRKRSTKIYRPVRMI